MNDAFVSYTCNKKNEPTMREDCESCLEYDPFGKNGKWCFIGALVAEAENTRISADMCEPIVQDMASPIMRDMSTATINLGNSQSVNALLDGIRKSLEDELYKSIHNLGSM